MQINKFGDLHDGKTIFFSKTDFLEAEFRRIRKIRNEVILITGNSDINVDDRMARQMPANIKWWYAQNAIADHPKIIPIPIGLENTVANKQKGQGIGWPHAAEKLTALQSAYLGESPTPSLLLYANFNPQTNPGHRAAVKAVCLKSPVITWQPADLMYKDFLQGILGHQATICPVGNGLDTHRLYEVLYCKRVPVVIIPAAYAIVKKLYAQLPIVAIEHVEQLTDTFIMNALAANACKRRADLALINFDHWKEKILTEAAKITPVASKSFFRRFFK